MMGSKQRSHAARTFNPQLFSMHAMLVSRSASHVASALQEPGRDAALAEGVADFIAHCGHTGLGLFLAAVWHWLDERGYYDAAERVQHYIETSSVPKVKATPRAMRGRDARV
ncbi:hypothetical protein P9250_10415 [Caballeronia sp. LP006]|jgi:hypothetical protein|uniref:hypothetical protein n=1 Tax=unclassified Caballeronia TaxID=2646786 RepID=UPI001FD1F8C6|nr:MULTISPECIES: hypothetical protein [unclassified Caballeronia]MDR5775971.1 hypothetical protein [Caballeronia sp. LZ002]MDR5801440.1 hypothetical protein [Caballeronia sp. LZ001]MDR5828285.1 hypothetical protein [Caballeronia sp. LP006]MDR5851410.1 hypothetical protein [Caballeronia sp. LZ003]